MMRTNFVLSIFNFAVPSILESIQARLKVFRCYNGVTLLSKKKCKQKSCSLSRFKRGEKKHVNLYQKIRLRIYHIKFRFKFDIQQKCHRENGSTRTIPIHRVSRTNYVMAISDWSCVFFKVIQIRILKKPLYRTTIVVGKLTFG